MTSGDQEKLTLSDWITFLSGEKSLSMSLIVGLGAFVVAVVALVVAAVAAIPNHSPLDFIGLVAVMVIALYVFNTAGRELAEHTNEANELLNKVMFGKLEDVTAIKNDDTYKKWKLKLDSKKKGNSKGLLRYLSP